MSETASRDGREAIRTEWEGARIVGKSAMAEAVRAFDWETTTLGAIAVWPEPLVTLVNSILARSSPKAILWGREMVAICNDAYQGMLGGSFPGSVGQRASEIWAGQWEWMEPRLSAVLERGETIQGEDEPFPVFSGEGQEVRYWTHSMNPISFDGEITGVLDGGHEVTERVTMMRLLAESEERLRTALSATDGIGIWDLHFATNLVYMDQNFSQYFRLPAKDGGRGVGLEVMLESVHEAC